MKLKVISKPVLEEEKTKDKKTFSEKKQEAMNNPIVADAIRIFNGTLIDIKSN